MRRGVVSAFQLDEEPPTVWNRGEDVWQLGDCFAAPAGVFPGSDINGAKLGQVGIADRLVDAGCSKQRGVVDDGEPAITRQLNVDLDRVGVQLPGQFDGSQRVLRSFD